jgi:uncharacterized membrane protein
MVVDLLALGLVVFSTFTGAIGALYLKKGSPDFKISARKFLKNKILVKGALLYLFGALLYIVALRRGELSVLYPLSSLTYLWVGLLSVKHLDEDMNIFKWSGLVIIVFGVAVLAMGF